MSLRGPFIINVKVFSFMLLPLCDCLIMSFMSKQKTKKAVLMMEIARKAKNGTVFDNYLKVSFLTASLVVSFLARKSK